MGVVVRLTIAEPEYARRKIDDEIDPGQLVEGRDQECEQNRPRIGAPEQAVVGELAIGMTDLLDGSVDGGLVDLSASENLTYAITGGGGAAASNAAAVIVSARVLIAFISYLRFPLISFVQPGGGVATGASAGGEGRGGVVSDSATRIGAGASMAAGRCGVLALTRQRGLAAASGTGSLTGSATTSATAASTAAASATGSRGEAAGGRPARSTIAAARRSGAAPAR